MIYSFHAYGHPNILATHKTTLEFTKDSHLTLKGDCIVGVNADFDLDELRQFIEQSTKSSNKKISITIKAIIKNKKVEDTIFAEINNSFNNNHELVIRKTDFASDRTFAINADKAAFELDRHLIDFLKDKSRKISVVIENKD